MNNVNQIVFENVLSEDEDAGWVAHETDPNASEIIILDFDELDPWDAASYPLLAEKINLVRDRDLRTRLLGQLVERAADYDIDLDELNLPSLKQLKLDAAIAMVRAAGMQIVGPPN